jgi:hypothetical protein
MLREFRLVFLLYRSIEYRVIRLLKLTKKSYVDYKISINVINCQLIMFFFDEENNKSLFLHS